LKNVDLIEVTPEDLGGVSPTAGTEITVQNVRYRIPIHPFRRQPCDKDDLSCSAASARFLKTLRQWSATGTSLPLDWTPAVVVQRL
jgi:hypothetical protein